MIVKFPKEMLILISSKHSLPMAHAYHRSLYRFPLAFIHREFDTICAEKVFIYWSCPFAPIAVLDTSQALGQGKSSFN